MMLCRVFLISLVLPFPAFASKKFLSDDINLHGSHIDGKAFKDDVINALGPMLGCGGEASEQQLSSIKSVLKPMWQTLPKSSGRIDRRSLRYLVHRYFMQTSSLMVRGFEPTRSVNESHWGVADVLSQMVPAYVESVLESQHVKKYGFSLKDAVNMVVMLEQLIFDAESNLLEEVYRFNGRSIHQSLSHKALKHILEGYMIEWMVDGDAEDMTALREINRSMAMEIIPHFEMLMDFAEGRMKALHHARLQKLPKGRASDIWNMAYSFQDAHAIVGDITRNFQTFWQSECESMKAALVSMDSHNTGRVPLSKFYHTSINKEWRFGESEAYLRELGALDESSASAGAQVIIPNYIQATSNCIVSAPHYLVCCQNECESILGEVEAALLSPTASPKDILSVVGNMTMESDLETDDVPQLEGTLTEQLEQIASFQAGVVPLHGRLFAQWLHYVFPTSCPFPHRIGAVSSVTPQQYGEEYIATDSERRKHAANASRAEIPVTVEKEELHWMSQWSDEEELIVDYSPEFGLRWETRALLAIAGVILLVFGITGGVVGCSVKAPVSDRKCWV